MTAQGNFPLTRTAWARLRKALADACCAYFHGGGHIERDEQGRINWRCATCGRWSGNPVPLCEEASTIGQHIKEADNAS